jgi:hypothetical protein
MNTTNLTETRLKVVRDLVRQKYPAAELHPLHRVTRVGVRQPLPSPVDRFRVMLDPNDMNVSFIAKEEETFATPLEAWEAAYLKIKAAKESSKGK